MRIIFRSILLTAIGVIAGLISLSFLVGSWIVWRFGEVSVWLIMMHADESPSVLPTADIVLLAGIIVLSVLVGGAVSFFCGLCMRNLNRRFGWIASSLGLALFCAALGMCGVGVFNSLDSWFSIRYEISCRALHSDFFRTNFVRINPADVEFPTRKNIIVIVSESLEERFADGLAGSGNLIPELSKWRSENFSITKQCQVSGANFTSGALAAMMYGIPKMLLTGDEWNHDTDSCLQFNVPSIWDVFIAGGYNCAYVQGGTFEFGAKARLFPQSAAMHCLGCSDMDKDPDYLAEPRKHPFGVNDEVMVKCLKQELLALASKPGPFAVMALTMNTHCPYGWRSAFRPQRHEHSVPDSIMEQDTIVAGFLQWVSEQEFANDTVVVVVGDHLFMGSRNSSDRQSVFNAVHIPGSPANPFGRVRTFSTLDWAPTFLELAGAVLPGDGSLGLGKSLLRDTPTLLEKVDLATYEREIRASHADYWRIVFGGR